MEKIRHAIRRQRKVRPARSDSYNSSQLAHINQFQVAQTPTILSNNSVDQQAQHTSSLETQHSEIKLDANNTLTEYLSKRQKLAAIIYIIYPTHLARTTDRSHPEIVTLT